MDEIRNASPTVSPAANFETVRRLHSDAEQFKLLADKSRLSLLYYLRESEICVCDLVALTGMSQPNVSQHMRKLKSGGLVAESRRGQWVYYRLNVGLPPFLREYLATLPPLQTSLNNTPCVDNTCCETENSK
jgi:ArsR family transcriptional regulator